MQQKQEQLQNDHQTEVESIIEECAQIKFEKMAEIKFMYKNCEADKIKQRDGELQAVKNEMEELKAERIQTAKLSLQAGKRKL